jgi:hypothetical protein
MKVSAVGTGPLKMSTKKVLQSEPVRPHGWQDTISWHSHISAEEKRLLAMRGAQAAQQWSENRAARIEELRIQVEAGTYKVDSTTLAQRMLMNQSLFLDLA